VGAGTVGTYFNLTDGSLVTSSGQFRGSLEVEAGDLAGWKLSRNGMYRVRELTGSDGETIDRYYFAGISSNTTIPTKTGSVNFSIDTTANTYYTTINGGIGGKNPSELTSLTTWRIPAYINGKPVEELKYMSQGAYAAVPAGHWSKAVGQKQFLLTKI
jgi:hypothetical protein